MVDATVRIAIQKLSDFLTQQVNIRIGVKDGVRWLKDELVYLQSSIRYAEARQEEELIRIWINNVRDVANEAVLILERFGDHQEKHAVGKKGVLDRLWSSICMCKKEANLYDIGKEMESLKDEIAKIKNRREEYGIANILATQNVQQRKRTLLRAASFQNKVDVVGFEDDFETLLGELHGGDPSLGYISIHGMGGLGKTTLASKLYHSSKLSHLKCRAWVCVSEDYNIEYVLRKIIKSFMEHEPDSLKKMDELDLLHYLHKLLLDSDGFLAVIDDIWDMNVWEKIKKAFPDKKSGSRILITTRNKEVAEGVDGKCVVHELRFLRECESWQLFCKKANPTPNLEKLGMEMVSKCRGLPLAIVVLSGLLSHKKSHADWSKVKDNLWRQLKGKSTEIQEILSLSYDGLSYQMRKCFLYLARYPEDDNFYVEELMRLWIAEEFISQAEEGDGVVMEDVAEDYLNELINRNLIQIARLEMGGEVCLCRVHDLVRDLAIRKANEEKVLGIFDSSKQHPSPIRLLQGHTRHAIYNGIGEYLKLHEPSSEDHLKLCSFSPINKTLTHVKIEEMKLMFTRFKNLKVLDLRWVESEGIPEEIWDMGSLKFLSLMSGISRKTLVISPGIGKLKKLQTLCGLGEYEIPREISELKELRHLHFPNINRSIGSLKIGSHQTKLQTLQQIRYTDWMKIDTVSLIHLRTLYIIDDREGKEGNEYSLDYVANLTNFQTFFLLFHLLGIPTIKPLSYCKNFKSVTLKGTMKDPSELSFLPDSVTHLDLFCTKFTDDPMPTLGSLSNLTALHLFDAYMGDKMFFSPDAFSSLQFLVLNYLDNLEELQVEDEALPSLKGLTISDCEKLKIVPQQLKSLPSMPNIYT